MGTNYYVRKTIDAHEDACEHCSEQETELVHLGKSSVGWKFCLRADPEWNREYALTEWLSLAHSGPVEDENEHEVDLSTLLILIMAKNQGDPKSSLIDYGPDITGPYHNMLSPNYFDCGGFDFCDQEFS